MMSSRGFEEVIAVLHGRFTDIDFAPAPLVTREGPVRQICIRIPPAQLLEVMRFLHDEPRCRFERLSDLTCVDYLNYPDATDRYGVTYTLHSPSLGFWLWSKCFVNDPSPCVPSVTPIWKGAEWLEREVWDLFGVRFEGHPDLRRIVTWEGFEAHPLRKDYPLRGLGEREDYKIVTRESA